MRPVCATTRWLLLSLLLSAAAAQQTTAGAADAWFDAADTNHDAVLSRTEVQESFPSIISSSSPGALPQRQMSWWQWFSSISSSNVSSLPSSTTPPTTNDPPPTAPTPTQPHLFYQAFSKTVCMIGATELGDKTFFIAAILSMKHDRASVYSGALAALILMTILSVAMGVVLPLVLDTTYTHAASVMLFFYFGVRLLRDAAGMRAGVASGELLEVEEELLHLQSKKTDTVDEEQALSPQQQQQQQQSKPATPVTRTTKRQKRRSRVPLQVALQALSLTFVAEWGDRSQIATIALAASHHNEALAVAVGGICGHAACTGLAVAGGRMLAARISEKTVATAGGCLFLLFAIHSLFFES
jgi:Ca2+/H+ antiporter, TMEM165/GDT1 family